MSEFDVFLCYNTKDKSKVRSIAETLKTRGLAVWFDDWELAPGQLWQAAIENIIETTKAVAVFVGEGGVGPWQDHEMAACLTEFVKRKLPVIPVLLPGSPAEVRFPLFLSPFVWVDLRDGETKERLDRLQWGITGRKPVEIATDQPELSAIRLENSEVCLIFKLMTLNESDLSGQDAFILDLATALGIPKEHILINYLDSGNLASVLKFLDLASAARFVNLHMATDSMLHEFYEKWSVISVEFHESIDEHARLQDDEAGSDAKGRPMQSTIKSDRLFMIFNHYNLKKGKSPEDDWYVDDYCVLHVEPDAIFSKMRNDLEYLYSEILESRSGFHGFAFIFLDPGWTDVLKLLSSGESSGNLADLVQTLAEFQAELNESVRKEGWSNRIRIVTASRLYLFLRSLSRVPAGRAGASMKPFHLLAGESNRLFYDAPKIVEAAIRIANIGRSVPIFRFDDDVIYYGGRISGGRRNASNTIRSHIAHEARLSIRALYRYYLDLSADSRFSCFMFSGRYKEVEGLLGSENDPHRYVNGYSTRVVQLADISTEELSASVKNETTAFELDRSIDLNRDAGFQDNCKYFLERLVYFGANPHAQVVSGAGLCLSDSAILDLPPFSNMRQNVMWIDDHLKYALHHELRHFSHTKNHLQSSRVPEAVFGQRRYEKSIKLRDIRWHTKDYMMRLLLGCVADAWLRADYRVKLRHKDWGERFDFVMEHVPAYYARRFQRILLYGWSKDEKEFEAQKREIKVELWKIGIERLKDFSDFRKWDIFPEFWKEKNSLDNAGTPRIFEGTFLGLFLNGLRASPQAIGQEFLPRYAFEGLAKAVNRLPIAEDKYPVEDRQPAVNSKDKEDEELDVVGQYEKSADRLEVALAVLVDDFVAYIDLVRFWRHFVQTVRYSLNWYGTRNDAIWMYPGDAGVVDS